MSIYFGGGTPALWHVEDLAAVITAVRARWDVSRTIEVTLEANPKDCTPSALAAWQSVGVTRVSIGVQSIEPAALVTLGRDHTYGDGLAAVSSGLASGLRVTVDVIAGAPGGDGRASVDAVAELGPGHVSVYELTVEPRTALARAVARGEVEVRTNDALAAIYEDVDVRLRARGYEHYEVSSYAQPGHRAVHNSLYWRGDEYLGLGNGAASFRRCGSEGVRLTNPWSIVAYMRGEQPERHRMSAAEVDEDALWLGLRIRDGVSEQMLTNRPKLRAWLLQQGLAEVQGDRVCPTLRGFLYADEVAARVVGTAG